jgi:hypothetical protein
MRDTTKSAYKLFLQYVSWVLGAIAVIAFFWGGRAINEFFEVDRLLAEGMGLGIMAACIALAVAAKSALDDMDIIEENEKLIRPEETGKQISS